MFDDICNRGPLRDEVIFVIINLKRTRFSNVFSASNYNGKFKSIS
ncbi:hypothetical protein Sarmat_00638 [Rickettsiales endosymbiont of Paramecium tredecaurelia]|nr:hypothetical protein [Candidatus Sarmatiella mevalonica]